MIVRVRVHFTTRRPVVVDEHAVTVLVFVHDEPTPLGTILAEHKAQEIAAQVVQSTRKGGVFSEMPTRTTILDILEI